jgi:hypothetical protein
MRLVALQSLMSVETAQRSGYCAPAVALRFPDGLRGMSPRHRPPFSCESGFILSCACPPLQSSYRIAPARSVRSGLPSLGFLLLIATSEPRVHLPTSFPRPPMFRPQRFSRSRRFAPLDTLRACFIPLPRPGFSLQGVSPLPSRADSSPSRSLLPFADLHLQQSFLRCPVPAVAPSGLCSRQRSVAPSRVISSARRPIPS